MLNDGPVSSLRRVPWLVIGGGISGLEAARRLGACEPGGLLVEASPRFGGIVRSDIWNGAVLDLGPDGWVAAKPQVAALCNELGLADQIVKPLPSASRLLALHGGVLTPMPAGLKLTIPVSPLAARHIAARDGALALAWVCAISGDVGAVVDQIDRRRQHAEHDEAEQCGNQRVRLKKFQVKYERGEHEYVLRPLARTHAFEEARDQLSWAG